MSDPNIDRVLGRRKRALELAVDVRARNGLNETAETIVARATEFDLFLEGAPPLRAVEPETASIESTPGVVALMADERVQFRTRDNAIAATKQALYALFNDGKYLTTQFGDAAALIVDALLARDDAQDSRP